MSPGWNFPNIEAQRRVWSRHNYSCYTSSEKGDVDGGILDSQHSTHLIQHLSQHQHVSTHRPQPGCVTAGDPVRQ